MSDKDCLVQVAQVLKSNGADGEIILGFRNIDPEDINLQEPVFIDFDELPVPFFISNPIRKGNSKLLVHLTDIDTFEDTEEIVGKAVYVREDTLADAEYEEGDFSFLVDWTLADAEMGPVGVITDFVDIPNNPCIEFQANNATSPVLIPLHDDLIIDIDEDKKVLTMHIPEGLMDLNN